MINRTPTSIAEAVARLAESVNKAKTDWLDAQMKRIMPPDLYALAENAAQKAKDRKSISRWMAKNKLALEEQPLANKPELVNGECKTELVPAISITRLMLGRKLVSEFSVRLNQGRAEVMVKDYPVE